MPNLNELRLTVCDFLLPASRSWRRSCHAALAPYGVSEACATPLLAIGRLGDGVHQITLARHLGVQASSIVPLLDQLERAKLIGRIDDPSDRRAKVLSLTGAGARVTQAIEGALAALRAQVLTDFSKAELEATLRVLHVLAETGGDSTVDIDPAE